MLKVLVVEDEEMIRKGIVLAVDWAALDCVVVGEAADGLQALKAVERYDPSLIITDLRRRSRFHAVLPHCVSLPLHLLLRLC